MKTAKMKPIKWGRLVGLEQMPKSVPGWYARSITEAIRLLRTKRVATSAGENGSLTVWRGKDGIIRAEFHRRMFTLNKALPRSIRELRAWLRTWWPRLVETSEPRPKSKKRSRK